MITPKQLQQLESLLEASNNKAIENTDSILGITRNLLANTLASPVETVASIIIDNNKTLAKLQLTVKSTQDSTQTAD